MTESDELKREIIAAPEDDLPRLIYADWLEENGQAARAEFIRSQIESTRAEPFSPQARAAETKADRLREVHDRLWTRQLLGFCIGMPQFRRGFIEHITVDPVSLVTFVDKIMQAEPIQSLRLFRSANVQEWLSLVPALELPQLQRLRQLELSVARLGFDNDEYTALLRSAPLRGIRHLCLRDCALQPSWLCELFGSDAFPDLTHLDVAEITNLGPGLLAALSPVRDRLLRSLDISGVMIASGEMQRLLACPCLQEAEALRMRYSGRGEPGPLNYLEIGWVLPWQRLRVLDVSGQGLGDDAVRAIAMQKEASSLRWLGLANNHLGVDSIRHLLNAKDLSLFHLDLRGNGCTPESIRLVRERYPDAVVLS